MSKKLLVLLVLFACLGQSALVAQAKAPPSYDLAEARRDYVSLNLEPKELEAIKAIVERDAKELERQRATIRESQARLAKLMIAEKPDLAEIGLVVRQSLDAEYAQRMIQISRNLDLRALLGDERWAALYRIVKGLQLFTKAEELREIVGHDSDAASLRTFYQVLRALR